MNNQPLVFSVIIGIIVIFVIVGASLVAKLSNVNKLYRSESIKNMQMSKDNEQLKSELASLTSENAELKEGKKTLEGMVEALKEEITNWKIEIEKLKKIKEVFEDRLKEELTKEEESESPKK